MEERRSHYPMCEQKLYKLPKLDDHISKERRLDELDRMREAREQKRTWLKTVVFCGLLNLAFVALGLYGISMK